MGEIENFTTNFPMPMSKTLGKFVKIVGKFGAPNGQSLPVNHANR